LTTSGNYTNQGYHLQVHNSQGIPQGKVGCGPPTSGLTIPHHCTHATCPLHCAVGHLLPKGHRITEWWGLEDTSVAHLVQTSCRSRVAYSRLHRTTFRRVLNISREGDSTTSLGSLCQCSFTLRGKKFFLMFRRNFLCFSVCPLPLVLSLDTTEKSLAPSS